ncbi:Uncharacterised protein [Achromobacter xylosoxidans]|nr:Uncharacterised protein [Achromobacter xylosoxidans]
MLGRGQLHAGRAQVGVGAGGFGRHRDAGGVVGGLGRLGVGAGRFHGAPDLAEQVHLVRHAGAGRVRPAIGRVDARRHLLQAGDVAEGGRGVHAQAGLLLRLGLAHGGLGAFEVGAGHAQVGVGGQGLFHQAVQHRVVVQPPPVAGHLVALEHALPRLGEWHLRARPGGGRVGGHLVVRAHGGAAGQHGGQHQRQEESGVHGGYGLALSKRLAGW